MDKITCMVLIGAPCSGKSTIGKTFANKHGWMYISSGDIARQMAADSDIIRDSLNNGNLAPEAQMRMAIWNRIAYCIKYNMNFILDGFPRFGEQAEWLQYIFNDLVDIHYVLIRAKLSTVIERSNARNRSDDINLEQRLDYYYGTTLKELCEYIDYTIDTDELPAEYCYRALEKFVEEVKQNVIEDCEI